MLAVHAAALQTLRGVGTILLRGWGHGVGIIFQVLEVLVAAIVVWALVSNLHNSDNSASFRHRPRARQKDETLR